MEEMPQVMSLRCIVCRFLGENMGVFNNWNQRQISWSFLDGAPSEYAASSVAQRAVVRLSGLCIASVHGKCAESATSCVWLVAPPVTAILNVSCHFNAAYCCACRSVVHTILCNAQHCMCRYSMNQLKFYWKDGSKFSPTDSYLGFFLSVAIAGCDNGISKVRC